VLPVTIRNYVRSGHVVAISSNSGRSRSTTERTGASGGYTLPAGFTGSLATQRREATDLARQRTGLRLDPVEADAYWGREAIRVRLADPAGSLALVARRALLLFDNTEHGLDYAPALDANPWRLVAFVPFAVLAGLAFAGVAATGFRGTGGAFVWSAILACALTPIVFYGSSRIPTARGRAPCRARWLRAGDPRGRGTVGVASPAAGAVVGPLSRSARS